MATSRKRNVLTPEQIAARKHELAEWSRQWFESRHLSHLDFYVPDMLFDFECMLADLLRQAMTKVEDQVKLAEHKIDQHLQGQYNQPPYRALGTALASARAALLLIEESKG